MHLRVFDCISHVPSSSPFLLPQLSAHPPLMQWPHSTSMVSSPRLVLQSSQDLPSLVLKISPPVVHAPDLATIFTEAGHLTCTTTLAILALGVTTPLTWIWSSATASQLMVVPGTDWVLPCQPIFSGNHMTLKWPHPQLLSGLPSLHN